MTLGSIAPGNAIIFADDADLISDHDTPKQLVQKLLTIIQSPKLATCIYNGGRRYNYQTKRAQGNQSGDPPLLQNVQTTTHGTILGENPHLTQSELCHQG